jgi:DNA repair photolyase
MSVIYEPSGKAREYCPLAINLYNGCNHGCKYCYVPSIYRKTRDQYIEITPRKDILKQVEKDAKKHAYSKVPVMFSFTSDPYNELDKTHKLTRSALEILLNYRIPVIILTKSGETCLRDLDIYKKFGKHIYVGATLTFVNDAESLHWEPKAANPLSRFDALRELKNNGVITWASFEPVIDPVQALELMNIFMPVVDFFKVGKLNNYKGLDKKIDWTNFLQHTIELLRNNNKMFYVKNDLVKDSGLKEFLSYDETNQDLFLPEPFEQDEIVPE